MAKLIGTNAGTKNNKSGKGNVETTQPTLPAAQAQPAVEPTVSQDTAQPAVEPTASPAAISNPSMSQDMAAGPVTEGGTVSPIDAARAAKTKKAEERKAADEAFNKLPYVSRVVQIMDETARDAFIPDMLFYSGIADIAEQCGDTATAAKLEAIADSYRALLGEPGYTLLSWPAMIGQVKALGEGFIVPVLPKTKAAVSEKKVVDIGVGDIVDLDAAYAKDTGAEADEITGLVVTMVRKGEVQLVLRDSSGRTLVKYNGVPAGKVVVTKKATPSAPPAPPPAAS